MKVRFEGKEYDVPGCAVLGTNGVELDYVYCLKRFQCRFLGDCLTAGTRKEGVHLRDTAKGNEALPVMR